MSGDVQILRGYGNLANLENVKPGMNLDELENQLINGGLVEKTRDPQDKFNEQLQSMARQFGISFGDTKPTTTPATVYTGTHAGIYTSTPSSSPPSSPVSTHTNTSASAISPFARTDVDDEYADDDGIEVTPSTFTRAGGDLESKTYEQERRLHINSVMSNISPHDTFSFENEKREDEKCMMLEEIDSLIYSLQDAEVDISRMPKVDMKSTYEEIDTVRKMLRHKNDRVRYCSLAEEFLVWGAYGMEELFDGKRLWLGKYKPCLTGWHTHVQCKLRRMRVDTAQLVSNVMHDYNIGPGARVLLELVPNMFIYSNDKKRNHTSAPLYSDDEMAAANERLRNI